MPVDPFAVLQALLRAEASRARRADDRSPEPGPAPAPVPAPAPAPVPAPAPEPTPAPAPEPPARRSGPAR